MCDSATRPAFIPVPNTARLRMVYSYLGSEIENVFHFRGDAPLIDSDLSGLVDEAHISWVARFKPHLGTGCVLKFIEATALDAEPAAQVTLAVNTGGNDASTQLPSNVTIAVKFSGGVTGRSTRGRMFYPELSIGSVSGDQVTDSAAADILAAVSGFFHDILTAVGLVHVIVSYCGGKVWRTTGLKTDVLFYLLTDKNIDSMRRRLAGRGT